MVKKIELTEQESTLRRLLLDVSDYISEHCSRQRPELRFTGGWVRDKLLGITSKDIDIGISSATGFEFGAFMKQYLEDPAHSSLHSASILGSLARIEANPEKSKHLETVTTKVLGLEIDLVNLRKEQYVEDSRNPTMEFGTPEEDALRRDATVNALFFNLSTSEVEDFTKRGLEDLESGIIRTPLEPFQTFKDDPLRILRCIRFAGKLGFTIDAKAEECMGEASIRTALRQKISRERVGIEVEKMLNGPRPHLALSTIHRLGLYNTIFTDPGWTSSQMADTTHWPQACNQLRTLVCGDSEAARVVASILECNDATSKQEHPAQCWLLCALVPWARIDGPHAGNAKVKHGWPVAASVAREGLKVNNKSTAMIKNAVLHIDEIIATKDAFCRRPKDTTVPIKRKQEMISREAQGMSIRRWGAGWRSSTLFALLVESTGTENEQGLIKVVEEYAEWLTQLSELDLVDAHTLKPLVDGKRLMEVTGRSGGPWLVTALNTAMEWQLRNPEINDPQGAISEVLSVFGEARKDKA